MTTCGVEVTMTFIFKEQLDTWVARSVNGEIAYEVYRREILHPCVNVSRCICNLVSLEEAEGVIVYTLSQLRLPPGFVQSFKTAYAVSAHDSAREALERGLDKLIIEFETCFRRHRYLDYQESQELLETLHGQRGFGAIPATDAAITTALKTIIFENKSRPDCTICLDGILEGAHVCQMPCLHIFHRACIVNWLRQSNSCPICRFRLQEPA